MVNNESTQVTPEPGEASGLPDSMYNQGSTGELCNVNCLVWGNGAAWLFHLQMPILVYMSDGAHRMA